MSNALPDYVVFNDDSETRKDVLKNKAEELSFPLSIEDQKIIDILEAKFDQEENCAGLAAPQIGFSKRIIVFSAPETEELKKWRPDFVQFMNKQIWINPSYEPIGDEMHEDYEGCFSVDELAAPVKRYVKISYKAFSKEGEEISGTAEGFLARMIQHETDHVNGILFIDKADKDKIFTIEEYRQKRAVAMQAEASE